MPAPSSPNIIVPVKQAVYYGVESATAGTAAAANITREACTSITTSIQRTPWQEKSYTGTAQSLVDIVDTAKYAQTTITLPVRAGGLAMQALACILGNGSDTVSGTVAPFTHTMVPNPTSTRCNTLTIWHDTGEGANLLQMTWGTVQSLKFTIQPTAATMAEIVLWAQAPTAVAAPTVANYVGSTTGYGRSKAMGYNNQFTFYGSGATNYFMPGTTNPGYTNTLMGGDFTIQRQLDPVMTAFNITPQDFIPGEIELTGNVDLRFDGSGAGTVWADYLALKELGDSTHLHKMLLTIDPTNTYTLEIDFYPIRFTSFSHNLTGQQVRAQVGFTSYADLSVLNSATPVDTTIKQAVLKNALSTVLVS